MMLNITDYWRNANQNNNEAPLHASQNFMMTLEKAYMFQDKIGFFPKNIYS